LTTLPIGITTSFAGRLTPGSVAVTGLKVGDLVLGCYGGGSDTLTQFETIITVNDQIQQLGSSGVVVNYQAVIWRP
jgi:hypothetical protein